MKRVISLLTIITMLLSLSTVGAAYEYEDNSPSSKVALMCLSEINTDLLEKNTSVEEELMDFSDNLRKKLLETQVPTEQEKIKHLITQTEKNISSYRAYSKTGNSIKGVYDPTYSTATLAIIAWFNSKGYYLAAELLTHAMSNDTLNSYYTPTYGSRVTSSPIYKDIINNGLNNGSASFPNSSNTVCADLYYGIHDFYYTNATMAHIFALTDKYDYADTSMYSGISGAAIQTMYYAQNLGVIVPFYTSIVIFY